MSARKFVLCAAITVCGGAQAQTIGIHTVSAHIPQHQQNNVNPGAYLRTTSGVELGFYRNSWRRPSVYASQQFELVSGSYGNLSLQAGLVSGYRQRCEIKPTDTPGQSHTVCTGFSRSAITPMAGFTYAAPVEIAGLTPRVQFVPPIGKLGATAHLTIEKTFN